MRPHELPSEGLIYTWHTAQSRSGPFAWRRRYGIMGRRVREDQQKAILMSKSISVIWTAGVSEQESNCLTETIQQVLRWLFMRRVAALAHPPIRVAAFGNWMIPALVPDRPYWGAQWYVDSSYDEELKRVVAPTFLELVRQEPWQRANPHFDLALLDRDLTDFPTPLAKLRPQRYSLGASYPGTAAVMSVHRVRRLAEDSVRHLALARLVRHHLGHVLGVPQFERKQHTSRLGLETHCTNRCAMRHADTLEALARLALEEDEMGWPYCAECTRDLHSVVVRYSVNWN